MNKEDIDSLNFVSHKGESFVEQKRPDRISFLYWNERDEYLINYNPEKTRIELIKHLVGLGNMGYSTLNIKIQTKEELIDFLEKLK